MAGTEPMIDLDIKTITFEEGDRLLLCSDGLSNKVTQEELASILSDASALSEKAEALIELANTYGGEDNISLSIIDACSESRCEKC